MILIDTSVLIEVVERKPLVELCLQRLAMHATAQRHISAVSLFEVEAGLFDGGRSIRARRTAWKAMFAGTVSCVVHDNVADIAARVVRETAATGKQLGALDALIAASALEEDLTLVTHHLGELGARLVALGLVTRTRRRSSPEKQAPRWAVE